MKPICDNWHIWVYFKFVQTNYNTLSAISAGIPESKYVILEPEDVITPNGLSVCMVLITETDKSDWT